MTLGETILIACAILRNLCYVSTVKFKTQIAWYFKYYFSMSSAK